MKTEGPAIEINPGSTVVGRLKAKLKSAKGSESDGPTQPNPETMTAARTETNSISSRCAGSPERSVVLKALGAALCERGGAECAPPPREEREANAGLIVVV